MKLSNILLISPEHWAAHTVSKHHYAMTLAARGAKVFFLNPPDDSLSGIIIQQADGQDDLFIVSSPKVARGLRFYPSFLRRWLENRWLQRLEKLAGLKILTIWLFENSRFFDMRFAGKRLKIYHQVDQNQEFNPEKAASTADICFCVTDFIRQKLLMFNPSVYKINHGLATMPNPTPLTEAQLNRFNLKVPHAVYIGNLEMEYLDVELLAQLARRFSGVQFHFIGDFRNDGRLRVQTGALSNVVWWGKINYMLIPAILDCADILLVAYKASSYKDVANSHKMMEYLACGKTIVATYTDEYKDKRHLLEMVDDSGNYLAAFERVVSNLAEYNSPEHQAERKAFARANTYEKQLDRIIELLKQHHLLPVNFGGYNVCEKY
jgi:glycosyltransferase involved in cell wall biosynthesis